MIYLTKIGGKKILLNEGMIESVSQNPDTIVMLSNGHSYIVQETLDEIMDGIISFNRCSRRALGHRGSDSGSD